MADDTYMPLVYMVQGGDEQVVASGGAVTVEDGGDINVESGGSIAIADGASIVLEVVTDTTAANMANAGISSIANASSGLSTFILDAPAAGVSKYVRCDGSFGSTAIGYIDAGSGVTISSTERYMSVKSAYAAMHFVGISATAWMVAYAVGSTASTGSTA